MTALTEKPGRVTGDQSGRLMGRLRAMTITVVVLAVAVLGLGAWLIYDTVTGSDTAVSGEIETLLDDYVAAWNDYDSEAFLALVTDDYTFDGASGPTTAEQTAVAISNNEFTDVNVEEVGDPIMFGDGPNYFVARANRITSSQTNMDGISLFTIVQQGDVYKIFSHVFVGSLE